MGKHQSCGRLLAVTFALLAPRAMAAEATKPAAPSTSEVHAGLGLGFGFSETEPRASTLSALEAHALYRPGSVFAFGAVVRGTSSGNADALDALLMVGLMPDNGSVRRRFFLVGGYSVGGMGNAPGNSSGPLYGLRGGVGFDLGRNTEFFADLAYEELSGTRVASSYYGDNRDGSRAMLIVGFAGTSPKR